MPKSLVNKKYKLHKFPGKGGWIYVVIKEIPKNKWTSKRGVRIKGTVDGYPINQYTLMPMKDGNLFFPIKSEIRKKIGKTEGDMVSVKLFTDDSALEIPDELTLCLLEEPMVHERFLKMPPSHKKYVIEWIFEAKRPETRSNRIVKLMEKLAKGKGFFDRSEV